MKERIELLDIKGHAFGLISTVLTVWSWTVAVDVFGKAISAICTLVLMAWGVKHFKSKIGVNHEQKKKLQLENELLQQKLYAQIEENKKLTKATS